MARKPLRPWFLSGILCVDFVAYFFLLVNAIGGHAYGSVLAIFAICACALDVVAFRMKRLALLSRGALALVTAVAMLANLPRAINPGEFDVILLDPTESAIFGILGLFVAFPCISMWDRLTPKRI